MRASQDYFRVPLAALSTAALVLAMGAAAQNASAQAAQAPMPTQATPQTQPGTGAFGAGTTGTGTGTATMGAGADLFNRLDSDSSGWLSRDEVGTVPDLATHWTAIDRDNDSRITQSEFARLNVRVERRN